MKNLLNRKVVGVMLNSSGHYILMFDDGVQVLVNSDAIFKRPQEGKDEPMAPVKSDDHVKPQVEPEVTSTPKAKPAAAKAPEPEDDENFDEWTMEELDELNREGLEEVIEDEDLDVDPEEFVSVSKLRRAIGIELGLV